MLRITLSLLLTSTICLHTSAQTTAPVDPRYYTEVRSFVRDIILKAEKTKFILEDSVPSSDFLSGCLDDTTTFSPQERQQIKTWATAPPFMIWTKDLVPEARIIPKNTFRAIFKRSLTNGWTYFHKHFGPNLNHISCPLFLRNYTFCICYSDYTCGSVCGEGILALYKKEGDHWVYVKDWGGWAS